MKQILLFIFCALATVPCAAQENKTVPTNEPARYAFRVSGTVLNEKSRPLPKITVCFVTAVRPSDARIPCDETDEKGEFTVRSFNIPDKYEVCASTGDLPFVPLGDKKTHVVCSEALTFGAADKTKEVNLRFKKMHSK